MNECIFLKLCQYKAIAINVMQAKQLLVLFLFSMFVVCCSGWVRGRNRETNCEGFFPGEYVKYIPKPVPRPRPSVIGNDVLIFLVVEEL